MASADRVHTETRASTPAISDQLEINSKNGYADTLPCGCLRTLLPAAPCLSHSPAHSKFYRVQARDSTREAAHIAIVAPFQHADRPPLSSCLLTHAEACLLLQDSQALE